MKNATQEELVEALKKQCNSIHTNFYQTDKQDLAAVLNKVVENYGGGPIITWKDQRFGEWGLNGLLKEEWRVKI